MAGQARPALVDLSYQLEAVSLLKARQLLSEGSRGRATPATYSSRSDHGIDDSELEP